jgi:hypothetical protein
MSEITQNEEIDVIHLLFPKGPELRVTSSDVDMIRWAFFIVMCTHAPLFQATFPTTGGFNPRPVIDAGLFTEEELSRTPDVFYAKLAAHRAVLAGVQEGWYQFGNYTDPPCPPDPDFAALVDLIKRR